MLSSSSRVCRGTKHEGQRDYVQGQITLGCCAKGPTLRKSFRSPLTAMLREARAAWLQARTTGMPPDEVRAMRDAWAPSRRQVLAGAAVTAAGVILPRRSL